MNQHEYDLSQDDDIDRTVEDEVRRVRMDAILTWPAFGSAKSREGQNTIASIGRAWAHDGLSAWKGALKTSAVVLKNLATSFHKREAGC